MDTNASRCQNLFFLGVGGENRDKDVLERDMVEEVREAVQSCAGIKHQGQMTSQ